MSTAILSTKALQMNIHRYCI